MDFIDFLKNGSKGHNRLLFDGVQFKMEKDTVASFTVGADSVVKDSSGVATEYSLRLEEQNSQGLRFWTILRNKKPTSFGIRSKNGKVIVTWSKGAQNYIVLICLALPVLVFLLLFVPLFFEL